MRQAGHECDAGADGVDDEHDADAVAVVLAPSPVTQVTRRPPADWLPAVGEQAGLGERDGSIAVPSTARTRQDASGEEQDAGGDDRPLRPPAAPPRPCRRRTSP